MNTFQCEKLGNIFMEVRAQVYTKFKPRKAACRGSQSTKANQAYLLDYKTYF